ncbi:MAG: ASCH domain-containing protein [Candidatus Limnocylindria bacterium]
MNFRPELAAAVMAGRKTVTRRLLSANPRSPWFQDRCGYRVGQVVAVCPGRGQHRIGEAVVTSVDQMALGWLSDAEAHCEGFGTAAAFGEAWTAINGAYDPEAGVWRIGLLGLPSGESDR